jgi:hypothetical protein
MIPLKMVHPELRAKFTDQECISLIKTSDHLRARMRRKKNKRKTQNLLKRIEETLNWVGVCVIGTFLFWASIAMITDAVPFILKDVVHRIERLTK